MLKFQDETGFSLLGNYVIFSPLQKIKRIKLCVEVVHACECIILWQFEVGSTNTTSRIATINPVMKTENGLPNLDYSAL